MSHQREEGTAFQLDWSKLQQVAATGAAVVPVVVQHADTGEVLILAYVNEQALEASLERGQAVFWSTSRNELWHKGATSGDALELLEVRVNCEQNSLLFRVRPLGQGVCHTKNQDKKSRRGCYYRRLRLKGDLEMLEP